MIQVKEEEPEEHNNLPKQSPVQLASRFLVKVMSKAGQVENPL